jgi:hypothetical protein
MRIAVSGRKALVQRFKEEATLFGGKGPFQITLFDTILPIEFVTDNYDAMIVLNSDEIPSVPFVSLHLPDNFPADFGRLEKIVYRLVVQSLEALR